MFDSLFFAAGGEEIGVRGDGCIILVGNGDCTDASIATIAADRKGNGRSGACPYVIRVHFTHIRREGITLVVRTRSELNTAHCSAGEDDLRTGIAAYFRIIFRFIGSRCFVEGHSDVSYLLGCNSVATTIGIEL